MPESPVALITLSGDYVGPPLARLLARSGHRLVLHQPTEQLVEELTGEGAEVVAVGGAGEGFMADTGGLDTAAGNEALVQVAFDRFGRLDAVCLVTGRIVIGPFLTATDDEWELVKRANLDMVYHGLRAVMPPMVADGRGQVVVFTSATGARPEPMVSLYSSTRAGANALVRAVGLEHAASGVTVNAIGTNYMDFPGFLQATGAADNPERRARVESQVPMRRLGSLDELAEFTAVLLDGRSRFQTGQFFSFSGGWST
ncbi:MAG: SDR family oxidoreductase [Actinobacteria bacterium]|nr:SDR family oxidoreductase [Actinomycetota bacterium]